MAKQETKTSAPKGYSDQSEDIVGYWDEDSGPIHVIPHSAVLFDNKIDKRNVSMLIFCTLVDACQLITTEEGQKVSIQGKPGDRVGVFGKPGLKAIGNLCDSKVYIERNGEKDVGKPEPMKLFKVLASPNVVKKRIPITADRRDKSFDKETFLDDPKQGPRRSSGTTAPQSGASEGSDDEIPF